MHPAIAALRDDDRPQRQAQDALFLAVERWREGPAAPVIAALHGYGAGDDFEECEALAALFAGKGARTFAAGFATAIAAALAEAPLAHVPLRHSTDGIVSTLLLAREGRAALFLTAVNGTALATKAPPVSVAFATTQTHEVVLAGSANADRVGLDRHGLTLSPIRLAPGTILARDASREALVLRRVTGTLVSLRLQRRASQTEPTREVDLATGRQIHQAAARAEDSRVELMIALLGRMGRSEAAPVLASVARESGPDGLRWQALRECLALDTGSGFAALSGIAGDPADPLAVPAGALRARLIEAHPQLAELAPCPA